MMTHFKKFYKWFWINFLSINKCWWCQADHHYKWERKKCSMRSRPRAAWLMIGQYEKTGTKKETVIVPSKDKSYTWKEYWNGWWNRENNWRDNKEGRVAVVVAQVTVRSLPIPEDPGSNPIIGNCYWTNLLFIEKTIIKKKRPGMSHFKKQRRENRKGNECNWFEYI